VPLVLTDGLKEYGTALLSHFGGYPFNAGHSVASMTYREDLMALPRPWQVIDR
jgi:hypothetical protein